MNTFRKKAVNLVNQVSQRMNKYESSIQQSNLMPSLHLRNYYHSNTLTVSSSNRNNQQLVTPIQSLYHSTNYNYSNKILINNNSNNLNTNYFRIHRRNQSQQHLTIWDRKQYGLCFLGAPGVGKGTYSGRIAKQINAKVLSSGDLIRDCAKLNEDTAMGRKLTEYINSGQLVPDDIVIPMVVDYLRLLPQSFILDGFPRTYNQAKRVHSEYRLHCVMHFKLPDHILIEKILGRRICTNCGSNFNVADINEGEIVMPSMAPKQEGICDDCGHELSMRPDDTEETIKERLRIFHEQTGPIEAFYKSAGLLVEHNIKKGIDDLPEIVDKMEEFILNNYPGELSDTGALKETKVV